MLIEIFGILSTIQPSINVKCLQPLFPIFLPDLTFSEYIQNMREEWRCLIKTKLTDIFVYRVVKC